MLSLLLPKDCTPPRKHMGNHGFPEAQEETLGQEGWMLCVKMLSWMKRQECLPFERSVNAVFTCKWK